MQHSLRAAAYPLSVVASLLAAAFVVAALLVGDVSGSLSLALPEEGPAPRVVATNAPRGVIELGRTGDSIEARSERPAQPQLEPAAQAPTPAEVMGALRWQLAGFSGYEVRVAVLDTGFAGYLDALGESLPTSVTARSFRGDEAIEGGTDHGLRAAQNLVSIAPGVDLYLLSFSTVSELSAAVDYTIEQGIDIVSFSVGFIHSGPGDGSGEVNEIVRRSTESGTLWVVASGNWAQQHWSGVFRDDDGDSVHEFAPGTQGAEHAFEAGDLILASLRWEDEWGAACSDYDLELFGPDGSLVRASRGIQDCSGDPVEVVQVLATQSGVYTARVIEASSEAPKRLDLTLVGRPDRGEQLSVAVAAGSLSEPADNPTVLTVGALNGAVELVEAGFSSRGPTLDGRAKPNLLAPTGGVTPSAAGGVAGAVQVFAGTSAAAPHAAGVAALLREALPAASRTELFAQLLARGKGLANGATTPRVANTGSLVGLGLLLPVGAEEAAIEGSLPVEAGLAIVLYRGPDGYPLRFGHLLTGGREPKAWFRTNEEGGWEVYIPKAPSFVNGFDSLENGRPVVVRVGPPEGASASP